MVLPQHVSQVKTGNALGAILQTEHCGIAILLGNGTSMSGACCWVSSISAGVSICVVGSESLLVFEASNKLDSKIVLAKY